MLSRVGTEITTERGSLKTPQEKSDGATEAFEASRREIDSKVNFSSPMGSVLQGITGKGFRDHPPAPDNMTEGQAAATLAEAQARHLESQIADTRIPGALERIGIGDPAEAAAARQLRETELQAKLLETRAIQAKLPEEDVVFASKAVDSLQSNSPDGRIVDTSTDRGANIALIQTSQMVERENIIEQRAERQAKIDELANKIRSQGQ